MWDLCESLIVYILLSIFHPYQVNNLFIIPVWCCIFLTKLIHIDSLYLVGLDRMKVLEKAKSIDIIMCHNKMMIGSEFVNVNTVKKTLQKLTFYLLNFDKQYV